MTRIKYIDTMKGIAIILVLLFHTINLPENIACIVNTLHNPTFYLSSGILLANSMKHSEKKKNNFKMFVLNKTQVLLYPFMLWVLIYSIIGLLVSSKNDTTLYSQLLTQINRLWFLPTLFLSTFIIYAYYMFTNDPFKLWKHKIILYVFCFLISVYSSSLGKIAFYTYIMWIGFYTANNHINIKYERYLLLYLILISLLFLLNDGHIHLSDTVIPGIKLAIFLSVSILGAITIYFVAQKISSPILSWLGNNTLYFYVLHYLGIELRDNTIYYIPNSKNIFIYGSGIITFTLTLLICCLFIAFCSKKRTLKKFVFGK